MKITGEKISNMHTTQKSHNKRIAETLKEYKTEGFDSI